MARINVKRVLGLAGLLAAALGGTAAADPLVIPGFGPQEAQAVRGRAGTEPAPAPGYAHGYAHAAAASPAPLVVAQATQTGAYGGGFFEMLASAGQARPAAPQPAPSGYGRPYNQPYSQPYAQQASLGQPATEANVGHAIDPIYNRQDVAFNGSERPGTIVIDTPNKFLFLVQPGGRALRYGIGVGRPGFAWSGVKSITRKAEWPGWTPPPEMIKRRPDLPAHMEGGPANPLGARAMYLGSSLYRIHGTNEPETIGTNVSSGCIRMMNEDVVDLYGRVGVGTKVIVM